MQVLFVLVGGTKIAIVNESIIIFFNIPVLFEVTSKYVWTDDCRIV